MKRNVLLTLALSSLLIAGCGENKETSIEEISSSQESTPIVESTTEKIESSVESTSNQEETKVFPDDMYEKDIEPEDRSYYYTDVTSHSTSSDAISKAYLEKYRSDDVLVENVSYGELYVNGKLQDSISDSFNKTQDEVYYLFYGNNKARVVDRAGGIAFSIPSTTIIKPNYDYSKYRTQYMTDDYCLTVSVEDSNIYGTWTTYRNEWLTRNIISDGTDESTSNINNFFKNNNLSYTRAPQKNRSLLDGYEIEIASILINDNDNIEFPYYNIGIVRKPNAIKEFTFFVMKSKSDMSQEFDSILSSYTTFVGYGNKKLRKTLNLEVPTYYSEETQKYYKKLMEQDYTEWGIFNYSMTSAQSNTFKIQLTNDTYQSKMGYKFNIMPTYTHTGDGTGTSHDFPLEDAKTLAGGNGFNNKPVLQFTLQYTANNNLSSFGYIPMFDIYRGKFDDYFKKMARDMKTYGRPILFRLNNEMNSDWCSYSGIVSLCDPDIFSATWERMAKIFIDEGCDNVLFIFNPTGKTFPYCSWGEDLCYLPSERYVQILGLTVYEYNNYIGKDPTPFMDLYENLYDKNSPTWINYPAIISEFGCGAGGDATGDAYRNVDSQANWVKEMFEGLNYWREDYDFISQIKGAVWFNANDYSNDGKVSNLLVIDVNKNAKTIASFKEGLVETQERIDKDLKVEIE